MGKYQVLILIFDEDELLYIHQERNPVNGVRLKAADTAFDSGYVEVI